MSSTWDKLKRLFVDDHKEMTRGYVELLNHLEAGNLSQASKLASHIDRQAGPHIEFEEVHLYPRVRASRGDKYVDHMYQQHHEIRDTLVAIQRWQPETKLSESQLDDLKNRIQEGIDHATACGTLLSHLETMPEATQAELLEAIKQLKVAPRKWSEMAS